MIISYAHKFIFIHLRKCAGTSITKALIPLLDARDTVLGCMPEFEKISNENFKNGLIHKHSCAQQIRDHVGEEIWKDFFVFTFVRNPWDILVSKYFWWHKTPGDWSPQAKISKQKIMDMSFRDYVLSVTQYDRDNFIECLSTCSPIEDSKLMGTDFGLDFIGKYENIQYDFDSVCQRLPLPKIKLKKANKSFELRNKKPFQAFYDDETRDLVQKIYQPEIQMFGYKFMD